MPAESKQNNTHYETGTAEDFTPKWFAAGFRPDSIVVDPLELD